MLYKHSEETKRKMSEARKGKNHPMFGKHHSKETLEKMSLAKKGKVPTHLVDYWKGRKQTPEHRLKSIKTLTHRYQKGQIAPNKGKKLEKITGENHYNWQGGLSLYRKVYNDRRKQRLANAEGSHTQGEWELLKIQYGFKCPMCNKIEPEIKLTQDHIIPLSKGGSNYIENIQPLCGRCNSIKKDKLIDKM